MAQSPTPATEGRIVHVRTPGVDHCQPAIVVLAWDGGRDHLNLQVFRDGSNDREAEGFRPYEGAQANVAWRTSVAYRSANSEEPEPPYAQQTWHWPTDHVGAG